MIIKMASMSVVRLGEVRFVTYWCFGGLGICSDIAVN